MNSENSIRRLLEFGVSQGWNGFYTRYWPTGDLDPVSAYLSKASWEKKTTPESAYDGYIRSMYGDNVVTTIKCVYRLLEDATVLLDTNHLGIMFPVIENVANGVGKPDYSVIPASQQNVLTLYREAEHALRMAKKEILNPVGIADMEYMINRIIFSKCCIHGLNTIMEGNRKLKDTGNKVEASAKYREAVEIFSRGLEAMAETARDDADLGLMASYYEVLVLRVREAIEKFTEA